MRGEDDEDVNMDMNIGMLFNKLSGRIWLAEALI